MDGRLNTFAAEPQGQAGLKLIGRAKQASAQVSPILAVWLEVGVVFALILLAVWTRQGIVNTVACLSAMGCILFFSSRSPFSMRELGLYSFTSGTMITLSLGIILAGMIAASGSFMKLVLGPSQAVPMDRAWQYAIWAFAQEFILQSFFYLRLKSVLGHRRAAWFAAGLFAVAHLPSPALTVLSFIGAVLFCKLFYRYRNLVPIGLVHAVLGLTIAASLPDRLLHHMRVGIGYLTYHR